MENIEVNSEVLIAYVYLYGPKLVASILRSL